MPLRDEDYVVINDFRPGIHHLVSPNTPAGACTDETFRCRATADGILVGAPRRVVPGIVLPTTLAQADLTSEEIRLGGIIVNDPVTTPDDFTFGVDQNNSEVYIGIEFWQSTTSYRRQIWRYLPHRTSPTWHQFANQTVSTGTYSPYTRPKRCYFATGRSNNPDPNQAGPIVVGWVYGDWGAYFPNEDDTAGNGVVSFPGASNSLVSMDTFVAHQGRAVIFPLSISRLGTVSSKGVIWTSNESFYWSAVNDWRTLDTQLYSVPGDDTTTPQYFNVLAGYENPTGYSVIASLAADQLFLIKARGGALIIRGDLDDFIATPLPNVRSAGQSLDLGTTSPIGYMYPVDNSGVWLWAGGDTAENLTGHLLPNFYRPLPRDQDGNEVAWGYGFTQSCQFNDYVMFGNNWFYDTTSGGWWHIDNPVSDPQQRGYTIHKWATDWKGRYLWGVPSGVRNNTDICLYYFDSTKRATTYVWTSHPITNQVSRRGQIREVIVVGRGRGQVKVEVFDETERKQDQQVEFDDPDHVSARSVSFGLSGTFQQIRVYARGLGGEAPEIHQLRVGINPRSSL